MRKRPANWDGHAERLMEAPAFPVCAPSLAGAEPLPLAHPRDLRHHTLLHDETSAGRPGVPTWSGWLQAAGASKVAASHGPVFASIHLAQDAAAAGHGVALGIAPLVAEDLRRGRLIQPFDLPLANAYAFRIVRRQNPGPATDAFCQWLRIEAAGAPGATSPPDFS